MRYFVCEDLNDAGETKIHHKDCTRYKNRKKSALTMKWHGPFETYNDALTEAKRIAYPKKYSYKDAECCVGQSKKKIIRRNV